MQLDCGLLFFQGRILFLRCLYAERKMTLTGRWVMQLWRPADDSGKQMRFCLAGRLLDGVITAQIFRTGLECMACRIR